MVYKEIKLPYPVDRKWFSMCLSVDREFLDVYLDGLPMLIGEDQDISSVQGELFCDHNLDELMSS